MSPFMTPDTSFSELEQSYVHEMQPVSSSEEDRMHVVYSVIQNALEEQTENGDVLINWNAYPKRQNFSNSEFLIDSKSESTLHAVNRLIATTYNQRDSLQARVFDLENSCRNKANACTRNRDFIQTLLLTLSFMQRRLERSEMQANEALRRLKKKADDFARRTELHEREVGIEKAARKI